MGFLVGFTVTMLVIIIAVVIYFMVITGKRIDFLLDEWEKNNETNYRFLKRIEFMESVYIDLKTWLDQQKEEE